MQTLSQSQRKTVTVTNEVAVSEASTNPIDLLIALQNCKLVPPTSSALPTAKLSREDVQTPEKREMKTLPFYYFLFGLLLHPLRVTFCVFLSGFQKILDKPTTEKFFPNVF